MMPAILARNVAEFGGDDIESAIHGETFEWVLAKKKTSIS
jgi:hypothetical protein